MEEDRTETDGKEEPTLEKINDFRNILWLAWRHLALPAPTPIQYDISTHLQNAGRREIIEGFRGVGKSWIASIYVIWRLYLDPTLNILVVSASKVRADDFSTFTLRVINEIPLFQYLRPGPDQRCSKLAFDVGPAPAAHAQSVKSLGITSQLTGSRADVIVADDIEVPNNSLTQGMRDKLDEQVKEFEAIIKPLDTSQIIFLGTPQCEDTVYSKLATRGYRTRIWPAHYVTQETNEDTYNGAVASICIDEHQVGRSTEPVRFSDSDLEERRVSYGKAGYELQFMLNPQLGDMERYPLKVSDLIVTEIDPELAPEKVVYASTPELQWDTSLPNVGLSGDRFHRPMKTVGDMIPFTGSILAVDPSGRGKDETCYCATKMLNGQIFVPELTGLQGGYDTNTLTLIAEAAKRNKANKIIIESNMGDGMFSELLKPILYQVYPCAIEEVRHHTQKERRIADTLEPVISGHKLIIDPSVIRDDYQSIQHYPADRRAYYSLIYQMSRLTRDKGSLMQDDRIDTLAIAVAYWTTQMAQDADRKIKQRSDDLLDKELRDFHKSVFGHKQKQLTWM